jgi:predicted lipoprotein with Yx(FWY)xxD motif
MTRLFRLKRGRWVPAAIAVPTAAAIAAVVVAGCGGGGTSYGGSSSTSSGSKPAAATTATLATGSTGLGKILVGTNGRSLYMFVKDKTPMSTCNGGCASVWMPFTTTGKPKAGAGVDAAKLTTSKRADGKQQVVYAGDPLYFYVSDTKAGDTKGQNLDQFGGEWYVVSPTGKKVEASSSKPASTTTTTTPRY